MARQYLVLIFWPLLQDAARGKRTGPVCSRAPGDCRAIDCATRPAQRSHSRALRDGLMNARVDSAARASPPRASEDKVKLSAVGNERVIP